MVRFWAVVVVARFRYLSKSTRFYVIYLAKYAFAPTVIDWQTHVSTFLLILCARFYLVSLVSKLYILFLRRLVGK